MATLTKHAEDAGVVVGRVRGAVLRPPARPPVERGAAVDVTHEMGAALRRSAKVLFTGGAAFSQIL